MHCRCASSPRVFLPFLYPTLFAANGSAFARSRLAAAAAVRARLNSTNTSARADSEPAPTASSRLNPAPDDYAAPYFADKAKLMVHAGVGGNGCISFLREAYLDDGPANGGDGGPGGNVYIQAVPGETSLHKLVRRKIVRAGKGKHGQGSARSGQKGDDLVITVPVGTVVTELGRNDPIADGQFVDARREAKLQQYFEAATEQEEEPAEEDNRHHWLLYPGMSSSDRRKINLPKLPHRDRLFSQPKAPLYLDLSRPTTRPILIAAGGIGGLGNPHFVCKERPKPMIATKGEPAFSIEIHLELKLLADVGLVGLPNAGKSTLLRALTNSRTRVGNWAFTTLQPNIGTVVLDDNKGRPKITSYKRTVDNTDDLDPFSLSSEWEEASVERRTRFTIADIPGLIEGAHLDKGLGIEFLRHVERAGVLAFVIDLSAGNAVQALKALWNEVGLYAQMREDEERARERAANIDWSAEAGTDAAAGDEWQDMADPSSPEPGVTGLSIAGKPWFVVATKGDLPDTEDNFKELREYLGGITRGEVAHPSGVEGAWTQNCTAVPVSAIHGQGVDRIVHWIVGLLDG